MTQSQQPAYMGEFLRHYKPPLLSLNTAINYLTTPQRSVFVPAAIITRIVQLPDVSFWQGDIDWDTMAANTQAVIIRIGQNLWPDKKFERNYEEAKKRGVLVGGYFFYDGRASPVQQADLLESLLRNKKFELEVFVDWEVNYGGAWEGLPRVVSMMESIEDRELDIKDVGMYTGYYFFRSNSNTITNANQYNYLKTKPLWEAWYSSNPADVLIPSPWTSLTHWQFGTPVVQWGQQSSELDMNFFNGSAQDFTTRYGGSIPPPNGGTMSYKITPDTSIGSKIRIDHNKTSLQIGSLAFRKYAYGTVIYGDINTLEYWLEIYEYEDPQGNRKPLNGWIASKSGGTKVATITEIPDAPPPPDPTEPTLTHTIEVYDDGSVIIDGNQVP